MPDLLLTDNANLGRSIILGILAIAVFTDVRHRKIFNALTFPAMAVGLIANSLVDGISGFGFALGGLLLGAAIFALPVAFLGRGAGDLKLLAALGAIGGPVFVIWCALLTGVAGAIFAVVVLLRKRRLGNVLGGMAADTVTGHFPLAASGIRLPYAVPIAAGAVVALAMV